MRPNLVGFAAVLFPDGSHSAIAEQINGKRDLTTRVLARCRELWSISSDWLLYGDCPKYAYQCIEPGETEHQVAEAVARRLNETMAAELSQRGAEVVSRSGESYAPTSQFLVDGARLLEGAYEHAAKELEERLLEMDVESVTIEALRQAQHAAVHGAKLRPMFSHAPFTRLLDHVQDERNDRRNVLSRVFRNA
jgi:hypothetical protein